MDKLGAGGLKESILEMVTADQKMRKAFDRGGNFDFKLDKTNTKKLKKIVRKYGWPTIDFVGKKASWGTWLLVQHADLDLGFQKQCLELMIQAHKQDSNNVSLSNIAFLKDRVLVNSGKKQLFGTQLVIDKNGKVKAGAIRDLKKVDQRRSKYGLGLFKDYLESARRYKPKRLQ